MQLLHSYSEKKFKLELPPGSNLITLAKPVMVEQDFKLVITKKKSERNYNKSTDNKLKEMIKREYRKDIYSKVNKYGEISSEGYNWIYKKTSLEMKNVHEVIDVKESKIAYFTDKYPEWMKLIIALPKLTDGIEIEFNDLYSYSSGDYYFGEWKIEDGSDKIRHGRGIYHFSNLGNEGSCICVCQFIDNNFSGNCDLIYDNGKKDKMEF